MTWKRPPIGSGRNHFNDIVRIIIAAIFVVREHDDFAEDIFKHLPAIGGVVVVTTPFNELFQSRTFHLRTCFAIAYCSQQLIIFCVDMSYVGYDGKLRTTNEWELIRSSYLLLSLLEGAFYNSIEVILWDLGEQILDSASGLSIDSDLVFLLFIRVSIIPSSLLSHLTEGIGVVLGDYPLGRQGDAVLGADLSDDNRREVEAYAMDLFRKIMNLCMRGGLKN